MNGRTMGFAFQFRDSRGVLDCGDLEVSGQSAIGEMTCVDWLQASCCVIEKALR